MKGLFVSAAIFYCLGILLVNYIRVSFWLVAGLGAVVFTAACLNFRQSRIFTVLVFLLGFKLFSVYW